MKILPVMLVGLFLGINASYAGMGWGIPEIGHHIRSVPVIDQSAPLQGMDYYVPMVPEGSPMLAPTLPWKPSAEATAIC
ncbi:MAG: hypothetical protein JO025_19005 [Verrucomicrobia bacterium]|nr:hypothetical protein [Verrucomicrobiota bacterium]